MESVNAGIARGAAWNVLLRVVDRAIGLLSTVILARLLVPADFGLVVLGTSLLALMMLLGGFGLGLALIQNPNAERRHFDTVWTFNVLFGLALAVMLVLLAAPTAHFYNEPRLVDVIFGLAIVRAISCFQNVGVIAFQKNMEFDKDFRFQLYKKLATTLLATIPLALIWRDYWALIGGMIAGSGFGLVLSYGMHPYRPRFSLGAFRELFGLYRWLQLTNILSFVSGRAADFIIGKFAGIATLGTFTIAKDIANLPSAELAMPVHRGVFPGYAKISGDHALLKRAYLRVNSVLVLVTFPAGIGLALVAQPIVLIVLGEKWHEVVSPLQILAVNGVLSVSLGSAAYVYLALGVVRCTTVLVAIRAVVSLSIMLWLVPLQGVQGAALALMAGILAAIPVNFRMMSKAVSLTLHDVRAIVWRPLAATIVMTGAVMIAKEYWMPANTLGGNALNLLTAIGIGAAAYCGTILLLWQLASRPEGAETLVLERLKILAAASRTRVRMWLRK